MGIVKEQKFREPFVNKRKAGGPLYKKVGIKI
jgi:hypothetical protein